MEVISFVTLFLGLVTGPQAVEIQVGEAVASVEIVLDGQPIGTLTSEPWRLSFDLGPELVPHELLAVARDKDSHEIGRAKQWINLARSLAEASLVIDGDRASGRDRSARLTWRCIYSDAPPLVSLTMDGTAIPVTNPLRIELPPFDPSLPHFLQAELEFPGGTVATAEAGIGGVYGGDSAARLTAIPLESGRRLPTLAEMAGWFQAGDQSLQPVAVEEDESDVVMVVSPEAILDLYRVSGSSSRLPKQSQLRFVWPVAETRSSGGEDLGLFSPSRPFTFDEGGLLNMMKGARPVNYPDGPTRVSDAVAVAGRLAAAAGHRRVVVLVLSHKQKDASALSPQSVCRYLASLHVPLVVWFTRTSGSLSTEWGRARRISSGRRLNNAARKLAGVLRDQHVVWLDGAILPQRVSLTAKAQGVHLPEPPALADPR